MKRLHPDGIKEVNPREFQSLLRRIQKNKIYVPKQIRDQLKLIEGDYLIIAIKKANSEDIKNYRTNWNQTGLSISYIEKLRRKKELEQYGDSVPNWAK